MRLCPEGWLYFEMTTKEGIEIPSDEGVYIIPVCSAECALGLFRPGPGRLDAPPESRVRADGPHRRQRFWRMRPKATIA